MSHLYCLPNNIESDYLPMSGDIEVSNGLDSEKKYNSWLLANIGENPSE